MTPEKRVFDLLLSGILVFLLLPVFLTVTVLVLVLDGRPVLFVSERMKSLHTPFRLLKFRTMANDTDADAQGVTSGFRQSRISALGRFLRRSHLDELPQLLNVIKGDLSLVGPRPPLRHVTMRFPDIYAKVLKSRPGITGLASLTFCRHEERILRGCRSQKEAEEIYARRCVPRKARLDLIYQSHCSLRTDLWLLSKTALGIFPANPIRVLLGALAGTRTPGFRSWAGRSRQNRT